MASRKVSDALDYALPLILSFRASRPPSRRDSPSDRARNGHAFRPAARRLRRLGYGVFSRRQSRLLSPAGILLLRQGWACDGDDADEFLESCVVARVGGVQGEVFGNGGGCDHQIGYPPARLAARRDHGGGHPAVDAGSLGVERDRGELALGTLQSVSTA